MSVNKILYEVGITKDTMAKEGNQTLFFTYQEKRISQFIVSLMKKDDDEENTKYYSRAWMNEEGVTITDFGRWDVYVYSKPIIQDLAIIS